MGISVSNSLKKIGYFIRFYRRQKGLSQIQMASDLGLAPRSLQRLEMGEVEPKLETLHRVATYLGVTVSCLIRPSDGDSLFIEDLSSRREAREFRNLESLSRGTDVDLRIAERLINQDQYSKTDTGSLSARLEGTDVSMSDDLAKLTGVTAAISSVDSYVAFGSSLERWEYVFRARIKQAKITNFYIFPKGFKVFEEFHYNLNPNPDSPTSECYIRDVTSRHELQEWLKSVRQKGIEKR